MKAFFPLSTAVLCLAISPGCAGGPKYAEMAERLPPISPEHGRIYFYRTSSIFGAAIQPEVTINAEPVGHSISGGFFFVDRSPGNCEVRTATEAEYKVIFTLAKNETRYVRTHISVGFVAGHVIPNLVDPSEGDASIRECSYTGDLQLLLPEEADLE
jgi:hypothetical protein